MRHIGTGMRPGSLLEVAIFLAGLALLFAVYRVYYRRLELYWLGRRGDLADRKFKEWSVLYGILPSDQELLLELASFLAEPARQKHLLFSDPVIFDSARRDMVAERPDCTERLLALRVRLNHPSKSSGRALESTTELPAGTLLFAPLDGRAKSKSSGDGAPGEAIPYFRVREILPEGVLAEFLGETRPGGKLALEIQRPDGHYRFQTSVIATGENFVRLQHAYHLERRQNRRYIRRDVSLEARLNRQPARIVNLGGGGARLHVAPKYLAGIAAGDAVRIDLELLPPPARRVQTTARVVAVRSEEHLLRVEFQRIRESDRDRIVKFVLTPAEESANPTAGVPVSGPGSDSSA